MSANLEPARLLREYRDCHALTCSHPAASGFREAWTALTIEERRETAARTIVFAIVYSVNRL